MDMDPNADALVPFVIRTRRVTSGTIVVFDCV